jgi:hypothetical protein
MDCYGVLGSIGQIGFLGGEGILWGREWAKWGLPLGNLVGFEIGLRGVGVGARASFIGFRQRAIILNWGVRKNSFKIKFRNLYKCYGKLAPSNGREPQLPDH